MTEEEQESEFETSPSADAGMKCFDGLDEGSSVILSFDIFSAMLERR